MTPLVSPPKPPSRRPIALAALLGSLVTGALVYGIVWLHAHVRGMSAFSWGAIVIGIVIGAAARDALLSWSWSKVKRDLRSVSHPYAGLSRLSIALTSCVPCDPDQCGHDGMHHCAERVISDALEFATKGSPLMKNDKVTQLFRVESCTKNPKGEMVVALVDAEDDGQGSMSTVMPDTVWPDLKVGDKIRVFFEREEDSAPSTS